MWGFIVYLHTTNASDRLKQNGLLFPVFSAQRVWQIYCPQTRTFNINILRDKNYFYCHGDAIWNTKSPLHEYLTRKPVLILCPNFLKSTFWLITSCLLCFYCSGITIRLWYKTWWENSMRIFYLWPQAVRLWKFRKFVETEIITSQQQPSITHYHANEILPVSGIGIQNRP